MRLLKAALFLVLGAVTIQPLHGQTAAGTQAVAAWTSATPLSTALTSQLVFSTPVGGSAAAGYNTVAITFNPSGSITGGVIAFEVTSDPNGNSNWQGLSCSRIGVNLATDTTYTLTGNPQTWQCNVAGLAFVRTRLSTIISGTGTVNITSQPTVGTGQTSGVGGVAAGGTSAADKATFTVGTTSGTPIMGAVAPVDTVVAGTVAMIALDTARNVKTNCINCAGGTVPDTTASGAIGAANANVAVAMAGQNSSAFSLPTGNNLVATLTPQTSSDGGTTWINTYLRQEGQTGNFWVSTLAANSTVGSFEMQIPGGSSNVRIIATAYTSGTATVGVRAVFQPELVLGTDGTGGNTAPPYIRQIGGSDGTNLRALNTDSSGRPNVNIIAALPTGANTIGAVTGTLSDNGAAAGTNRVGVLPAIAESNMPTAATTGRDTALRTDLRGNLLASLVPNGLTTYAANKQGLVPASAPTDIAVLPGNATNTVIATKVVMSCTQTTAGIIDIQLIKRSTADTAGTSAAITAVPLDSNNAAAVSAPLSYTANPTTGTAVGNVDAQKIGVMAPGTASPNDIYIWKPGYGQSVVLRGTAQQLAINLNGITLTGGSCDLTYEWIETTGL